MRTYLGIGGTTGKSRVYLGTDCLEVEEDLTVDVIRRRIYLDDVLMVTHSRRFGWYFLVTMGVLSGTFALTSLGFLIESEIGAAALFALVSIGFIVPMVVRLITRVDVITIFGRRKQAEITFGMNKTLIKSHFEKIVNAVREQIEVTKARIEREKPPEPLPEIGPTPEAASLAEVALMPETLEVASETVPPVEVIPESLPPAPAPEPDLLPPPSLSEPEFPKSE